MEALGLHTDEARVSGAIHYYVRSGLRAPVCRYDQKQRRDDWRIFEDFHFGSCSVAIMRASCRRNRNGPASTAMSMFGVRRPDMPICTAFSTIWSSLNTLRMPSVIVSETAASPGAKLRV